MVNRMINPRYFPPALYQTVLLASIVPLILAACLGPHPTVQYIGHSYPPVERIDMYLAEDSIPRAYRVMGRLQAEAPYEYRADKVQEYVVSYAAEHGASAVIIEGLDVMEGEPVHETQIVEKTQDNSKSTSVSVTDSIKNAANERQRTAERSRTPEKAPGGGTGTQSKPAAGTKTSEVERTSGESTSSTTIREVSYRPRWLQLRAVLIRYE